MTDPTPSSHPDLFTPDALHVVFGCNGPVGVALLAQLVERGVRVRGVCRSGVGRSA
ncbi:MAG: NAD(P)-dependent oxidoreductase [Thermoanaerobaculia bacterium]|nr:NAD(P)-dependent oxidoreductase [Thermoanaerobaculia bacterium]